MHVKPHDTAALVHAAPTISGACIYWCRPVGVVVNWSATPPYLYCSILTTVMQMVWARHSVGFAAAIMPINRPLLLGVCWCGVVWAKIFKVNSNAHLRNISSVYSGFTLCTVQTQRELSRGTAVGASVCTLGWVAEYPLSLSTHSLGWTNAWSPNTLTSLSNLHKEAHSGRMMCYKWVSDFSWWNNKTVPNFAKDL